MSDAINAINAVEMRSVFLDIKEWLTKLLPSGTKVTIADMGKPDALAIVPAKGVKRHKEYACGGYEVYLPFSIYYRGIADDDSTTAKMLDMLDNIGCNLELNGCDDIPKLVLSGNRELLQAYQELTAVKYKQTGKIGDFTASYVLIYAKED